MIEICRDHSANVKRWRDGQMALRWCPAGMVEAGKQFRKVNGFLHLPALRTALDNYIDAVSHRSTTTRRTPPEHHRAATEVLRNSGHPPAHAGPHSVLPSPPATPRPAGRPAGKYSDDDHSGRLDGPAVSKTRRKQRGRGRKWPPCSWQP